MGWQGLGFARSVGGVQSKCGHRLGMTVPARVVSPELKEWLRMTDDLTLKSLNQMIEAAGA